VGGRDAVRLSARFEEWSRVIGGILLVADIPGFLWNIYEFYDAADAEGLAWRALVEVWWETFGDREVGVADLITLLHPETRDPIDLHLGDGGDRSQRTRLGALLRKQRDRQYGRFRIVAAGTHKGAQRWRLIDTGSGAPR
jgi:putative DNA primase/helicase